MKKLVILFIASIVGIILTQIIGTLVFNTVSEKFHLLTVMLSLFIKLVFYSVIVYTLIQAKNLPNTIYTKIFKSFNWLITIFLTIVFVFYAYIFTINQIEINKYYNPKPLDKIPSSAIEANVYQLINYNGMSKDFILGLRMGNLGSHFSKLTNYSPNEKVWGKMLNEGAWLGLNRTICFDTKTECSNKLKGFSALSRIINNPMILVAPTMIATYHLDEHNPICLDKGLKLIPQKIYMDTVNSKITVIYNGTTVLKECKYLQLTGLNARDFGLEWGKVTHTQNVKFPYQNNISKKVYQFKDEIVLGNYCQNSDVQCNILSPIDDKVVFNITSYPASIELNLWDKKPVPIFNVPKFKMEIRFVN